jgi:SAM-dependent methyltransferase
VANSESAARGRDSFSGSASVDGYWRTGEADMQMQRGNLCVWEAMAELEAPALPAATVLDVGCNMGGFLRFLHDRYRVPRALGFDPASGAIDAAREQNDGRPIEYVTALRPEEGWPPADLAFSQEVVYLIDDLAQHADDMWRALRAGGRYIAVTSVHRDSALMSDWHAANAEALDLPPLRDVAEYLEPFMARGFRAEIGRLQVRTVPLDPSVLGQAWELLEFWTRTNDKVLFRFVKD